MNLELLEEIHTLRDDGVSDVDIASSLAITKQNLLLMMRIEKIVTDKYEDRIKSIDDLIEQNSILSNKNEELLSIISKLKSTDQYDLSSKVDDLLEEVKELKAYRSRYYNLKENMDQIPNFLKLFFVR